MFRGVFSMAALQSKSERQATGNYGNLEAKTQNR